MTTLGDSGARSGPAMPKIIIAGWHALLETGNDVSYASRCHTLHLYDYPVRLTVDSHTHELMAGDAAMARGGTTVHYNSLRPSSHFVFHFDLAVDETTIPRFTVFRLGGDVASFTDECERIRREFEKGGEWPSRSARAGLYRLICALHATTEVSQPAGGKAQRALLRATEWIDANLHLSIRVEDLARDVELDRNYLARKFKEAYGETIQGYVRNVRLRRARHWLANTDLPIKVIAADLGFYDLQHFYRCFNAQAGITPGRYRENAGRP